MTTAAVIGHVEWIRFARVDRVPAPGQIVHARESWEEPAGGGAVAAVQLAKLAGACTLYTALGDDDLGHRIPDELDRHGVRVEAVFRPTPQRQGFTFLDDAGERTITVLGDRLGPEGADALPWDALDATDAVYFTAGDDGALRHGRRAGALVATSRVFADLARAGVQLDALVGSGLDPAEALDPAAIRPVPRLIVVTAGAAGGAYRTPDGVTHPYPAAPLPGPLADTYGCGDSFAAGLAFGLGSGLEAPDAVALAARCGAACLTGRGPYTGQLRLV